MATSKIIPIKPLSSWSYSRFSDWRQCPLKAKIKHIDRIKEPGSTAMDRGNQIHKDAEAYIKGLTLKLAPELKLLEAEFKMMRKAYKNKSLPMIVEDNWALDKNWDESRWDDWTNCWVRIKLDAAHYTDATTLVVTDWKSGKVSDYKTMEYLEQLELYALSALLLHPHIEKVQVRIGWTDAGLLYPKEPLIFTRADLPRLKKEWNARVKPMMTDTKFVPKPNHGCQWCYFGAAGQAKGGPGLCKY